MKILQSTVILLHLFINVLTLINVLHQQNYDHLVSCIQTIYSDYIHNKSKTLYIHENDETVYLKFNFPIIIYKLKEQNYKFEYFKKIDAYIFVITKEKMKNLYEFLHQLDTWNPRAKTILICNGVDLNYVFKVIITHNVINVIIFQIDDSLPNNIDLFTYFPYAYENFNNPYTVPFKLATCTNGIIRSEISNLFPNKLKNKFWRNSTAKVSYMFLQPYIVCAECGTGVEIQLIQILSDKLKFKVEYEPPYNNWGIKQPNGTYEGAMQPLQNGTVDFVTGYFHLREIEHLIDFDYTFSYMEDDVTWAVPIAEVVSHWSNLINIFQGQTWLFILLTVIIAMPFVQIVGRLTDSGYYQTLYSIEVPLRTLILISCPVNPRSLSNRLLYISMWYFSFVIMAVWNAYLIYFLTHETRGQQYKSTDDLVGSNLIMGLHPELAEMYRKSNTSTGRYIYDTHYACDPSYYCMNRVAFTRDMASVTTRRIVRQSSLERYQTPEGDNLVELLKESVVKDYVVMYFQKGHPMFDEVNELLLYVCSGGFVAYFDDFIVFLNSLKFRNSLYRTNLFETKVLTMDQMKGAFYLLGIGLSIAFLILLLELYLKIINDNGKKIMFLD